MTSASSTSHPGSSSGSSLVLVGRSSSHFTRVARIFAAELDVPVELQVTRDLLSLDAADYGDNPALKIPTLRTPEGVWFGALNICRELARRAPHKRNIVWPEALTTPLLSNAQELTLHAMATEVNLVLAGARAPQGTSGGQSAISDPPPAHVTKMRTSLLGTVEWLERSASAVLAALPPERDLSFLEVCLFCLVRHLEFRGVLSTEPFASLRAFSDQFETRASAQQTPFVFDAAATPNPTPR